MRIEVPRAGVVCMRVCVCLCLLCAGKRVRVSVCVRARVCVWLYCQEMRSKPSNNNNKNHTRTQPRSLVVAMMPGAPWDVIAGLLDTCAVTKNGKTGHTRRAPRACVRARTHTCPYAHTNQNKTKQKSHVCAHILTHHSCQLRACKSCWIQGRRIFLDSFPGEVRIHNANTRNHEHKHTRTRTNTHIHSHEYKHTSTFVCAHFGMHHGQRAAYAQRFTQLPFIIKPQITVSRSAPWAPAVEHVLLFSGRANS